MYCLEYGEHRIVLEDLKVIDMRVGDGFSGCRCSTQDRNRYDKESKTIICENYSKCLSDIIKRMRSSPGMIEDLKEYAKVCISGR